MSASEVFVPGNPIQDNQLPSGYLYPGEYKINNSSNLVMSGEFLYWAANRLIGDVASRVNGIDTKILIHEPGYRPGFRVMLGFEIPTWDNMHIDTIYTWWHNDTTTQHSAPAGTKITPLAGVTFVPIPATQNHVKSKFRLHIDFLDLVLVKSFYIGKRIILEPYYGLIGAWCKSKQKVTFNVLGFQESKHNFWAIGPEAGFNIRAMLWWGIFATAKADITFPYLRQTHSVAALNLTGAHNVTKNGSTRQYMQQPFVRTNAGIGWGTYFSDNEYHLNLSATYDYWSNYIISAFTPGTLLPADLSLHGYSFKATLDF